MHLIYWSIIYMDDSSSTIFTNMPSLLNSTSSDSRWPLSLRLPNIFNQDDKAEVFFFNTNIVAHCPHPERKPYAKNQCSRCYHKYGRVKLAWACSHTHRHNYAKGRCHSCYLQYYYKKRRH
mmetsp:Transcript_5190/g.9549  ORF Transcript_5190/g.9549 Transcript_5190/m.9549 type:complete len:121 (+) Transcript_5190:3-365(+)